MRNFYMKKCDPIVVPKGIRFISDWEGYDLKDYPFPHILNKVLTGCGFTEYCIRNDQPLVLISPRIFLIENKEDQHPGEVFRVKNEVEKMTDYETDIRDSKLQSEKESFNEETKLERIETLKWHIREYTYACATQKKTPKILVTYDSFRHVKDALGDLIGMYQIVVDEFQSIFIDARFKSDTEIDLLYQLQGLEKVCFVSATPMLDRYLDMLPEFCDLPYYELDWKSEEPSRVIKPKLEIKFTTRSLNEEAGRVIHSYQEGKFEAHLNEDGIVESKEAVLFFNSVSGICQAIRSNNLHIEQCNILCAKNEGNRKKVRDAFNKVLKNENPDLKTPPKVPIDYDVIGKIPKVGEPHKMFTFCTRTVYLGADFYSTNARTFIFSDSNIDCLSVDISMDLEQILGRQRLKENPWKNYAKMFVKVTSLKHKTTKEEFDKRLEEKKKKSENLLSGYWEAKDSIKHDLAEKFQRDAKASYYKYDYVAVNTHAGKDLVPVFNNLMMVSEMRSFEVQQIDYKDRFSVFNAVNERGVEGIKKEVQEAAEKFNAMRNSVEKLKALVELAESRELGEKDFHDFLSLIPERFRDYYIKMGPDRIRANSFQESRLKEEWIKQHREEEGIDSGLVNEILSFFKLGQRYTNPDIKAKLKELYQKYGYDRTAKASDLEEYFWLKKVYLPSIKKNGFEIQKKR
jgi:hypothetical protein